MQESDFVDLHIHSTFSLLDGAASPEAYVQRTKELGRSSIALTDHGSMDGIARFSRACRKSDILPIFGVELYMLEDWEGRAENKKQKNLHLTALAKTPAGLSKLLKGLGYANREGKAKSGRSVRAFLPVDYPINNGWAGDIVILSGCASSPFWNIQDESLLGKYVEVFKDDFHFELMPVYDWDMQGLVNQSALEMASAFGKNYVATTDAHYLKKSDSEWHEVVLALSQSDMTWKNPKRWKFDSHCSHIHTVQELEQSFSKMGLSGDGLRSAVMNTREIADKCFHKLPPIPVSLPKIVDGDENEYFMNEISDGLDRLGLSTIPGYLERAGREVDTFISKKFVRYMLMVADVVKWAKSRGIMIGPGRGSVGGSLVAYLLGITTIDPLKHGLFFERFIAQDRQDAPDVDVDVSDRDRHLIEQYLKEKYGTNSVAHISTFSTMRGRMAMKDVGRIFEVPLPEVEAASANIIKPLESDERAYNSIEDSLTQERVPEALAAFQRKHPQVIKYACALEGQIRGNGIHAAGFVVVDHDLRETPWAYVVNRDGAQTINWDKDDLETFGYIKLDLLGLKTLSAIEEALNIIKNRHGVSIDLTSLPLTDAETLKTCGAGEVATVFQLSAPGTMAYCKKLKPDCFEHLYAILALWRPGPIGAGMTDRFIECRFGRSQPVYLNEAHRKITERTYGEIIYQEQISQMLTDLAGYSWKDADKVRKIISKKLGAEQWAAEEGKFVAGCLTQKSISEDTARQLWKDFANYANYGFNKCIDLDQGVATPFGVKKAKDIKIGDKIYEAGIKGQINVGFVRNVWKTKPQKRVRLVFDNGAVVICSYEHRFLTPSGIKTVQEIISNGMDVCSTYQDLHTFDQTRLDVPSLSTSIRQCFSQQGSLQKVREMGHLEEIGQEQGYDGYPYNSKIQRKISKGVVQKWIKTREQFAESKKECSSYEKMERSKSREGSSNCKKDEGCPREIQVGIQTRRLHTGINKGSGVQKKRHLRIWSFFEINRLCWTILDRSRWSTPFSSDIWAKEIYYDTISRYCFNAFGPQYEKNRSENIPRLFFFQRKNKVDMERQNFRHFKTPRPGNYSVRKLICWSELAEKPMVDIEVGGDHLYVLDNGIITHNSHAVGYGIMAYWTAYLKTHYPAEWLCAYLNYGNAQREDVRTKELNRDVALREAQRLRIEILPPDINASQTIWTVEDKDGKPSLRAGLQEVKFLGGTAIEEIRKFQANRKTKISDIKEFLGNIERKIVNRRVLRSMIFCGVFDSILGESRVSWLSDFDAMLDDKTPAAPLANLEEIIINERRQYLRFDPVSLCDSGDSLAKVLGGEIEEDEDGTEFIKSATGKWDLTDALSGIVSNAPCIIVPTTPDILQLQKDTHACKLCELRKSCKRPVPLAIGEVNAMIVAEAPGQWEDEYGIPLIGKSGNTLWEQMKEAGAERQLFYISNSVKCRPPNNTKPTPEQIDNCPWLDREIKAIKPRVILALGNSALYYFTGREKGIMAANANVEFNSEIGAWIVFGLHPAMVGYRPEYLSDFQSAIKKFVDIFLQFV